MLERKARGVTNDNQIVEPGLRGLEVEEEEGDAASDCQGQGQETDGAFNGQSLHTGQHAPCNVRKQTDKEQHLHISHTAWDWAASS